MTKATMLDHLWFMNIALEEAELAYKASEVPVGAVLVSSSGSILSKQFNLKENHFNPTGHAEILCLTEAGKKIQNWRLSDCTLYVTLEPCPMCLTAISMTKIQRIFYGANDPKFGAVESNPLFSFNNLALFKPEIYSGINANESANLLSSFFAKKR